MSIKLLPVIHYASDDQVLRNAELAFDAGCDGVFVIHMEGANHLLVPVARQIKARWPNLLVGVNHLGLHPAQAVINNINAGLDMTWTDAQLTHTQAGPWKDARQTQLARLLSTGHQIFVGVAFKHQQPEPDPVLAALLADQMGFIATTSGSATGVAAAVTDVSRLSVALQGAPLAIASGITPENVVEFAPHLSHLLVATGVSSSFYEFDAAKLHDLRRLTQ